MTSLDDVARVCLALPDTSEVISRGARQWRVHDKLFVWERPLRRRDLEELAHAAPAGIVLGARVPDEGAKAALIADDPQTFFTTSHFDGYPAVLCRLDVITEQDLEELAAEAWACRAPRRLLAEHPLAPR
jgi:hypothetical protein